MHTLRLFGGVSVDGPTGPLTGRVAQRRRLASLAMLAAARGKGVTREKLAAYLWPDSDDERARHQVADTLYVIRSELGPDAVQTSADTVRLNSEAVRSDLELFESALERGDEEAAVLAYCGPFLDGLYLSGAQEFEMWADTERQRLAGAYGRAVETLAEAAESTRDYRAAADWWQRLVMHDPYNSRFVVRLMRALAGAGDPANGLKQAQEHQALLKRELEIDPPPELLEAVEGLAAGTWPDLTREASRPQAEPSVAAAATPVMTRPRFSTGLWLGLAVAAGVVAAIAIGVWRYAGSGGTGLWPAPDPRSVAVLPLENLSADPDDEFLSYAIAGEVIGQLSKVADLKVISRTSSRVYANTDKTVQQIGQELNVATVLEGQVQVVDSRVRISAQLVDASTDELLWSEQYNRDRADILDLQSEVARHVASALRATLTPEELGRIEATLTDDPQAYEYYLRALAKVDHPNVQIEQLKRAVELDPNFAVAWADLASIQVNALSNGICCHTMSQVEESLARAKELGPNLAATHRAEGWYYYAGKRDYERAYEHLQVARRLQPTSSDIEAIGLTLERWGRWEEAIAVMEEASQLDPHDTGYTANYGRTYMRMRRYADAERIFDRVLWVERDHAYAHIWKSLLFIKSDGAVDKARQNLQAASDTVPILYLIAGTAGTGCYAPQVRILTDFWQNALADSALDHELREKWPVRYWKIRAFTARADRPELARAYFDSALAVYAEQLDDSVEAGSYYNQILRYTGFYSAWAGHREQAIEMAERAAQRLPVSADAVTGAEIVQSLVEVYILTGEYDKAFKQLDYVLSIPSEVSVAIMRLDPVYDPIRADPRFQALLRKYE
jgi:serine/threonine-protein kinase